MAIEHAPLYEAARAVAAREAARLTLTRVPRGTVLYRNVPSGVGSGPAGADAARTIGSGRYSSQGSAENRWTGLEAGRRRPRPGTVGGLYVTEDLDALVGELFHYSLGMTLDEDLRRGYEPPDAGRPRRLTKSLVRERLPKRRLFVFRAAYDLDAGDLRTGSGAGRRFLGLVWHAPEVRDAARDTSYRTLHDAYTATRDHAFTRGVAQGLWDARPALSAIRVTSVRTEFEVTAGRSGINLVFLGKDGRRVDALAPDLQYEFKRARTGTAVRESVQRLGAGT